MNDKPRLEAPRLFPTLQCQDAEAMIRWLVGALGFEEYAVYRRGGTIKHAELAYGSSILMLGQHRDDDYARMLGDPAGRRTDALYLAVDDPDALHERVKASGARIERAPYDTDHGSRDFACRDPEGNLWYLGSFWPKAHETPAAG